MSMCVFDVLGNVSMESPYLSVYRKGQMLVLEFVNNLIVPFRVVPVPQGGVDLFLVDELAFTVDDEKSAITVVVSNLSIYADVQFDLMFGVKVRKCSATAGYQVVVNECVYLEPEVLRWCEKFGIHPPAGCVYSSKGMYINRGCDVDTQSGQAVVSLPGGLKFPILRTQSGLCIAGFNVERRYPDLFVVYVRVKSRRNGAIHFRVSVWEPEKLTVLDDVVYTKSGIMYGENFVSAVEITKQLVLRAG